MHTGIFWVLSGNKVEGSQQGHVIARISSYPTKQDVEACVKAILFVDDHQVLARLSCEILEMQGYRAVSAYNAEEALEKFGKDNFDILVTDFRMEGMNGLELAKKIHDKSPETPVIIVTGYGPIDTGKEVNACLQKEDLFPALLEKIKFFLGEGDAKPLSKPDSKVREISRRPAV